MKRLRSFFTMRRLALVTCGVIGTLIADGIYEAAVRNAYADLREAIVDAAPLAPLLAQDPSTGVSPHCSVDGREQRPAEMKASHVFRALQLAALLPVDSEFAQVPEAVRRATGVDGGTDPIDVCERGIPLLIRLAQAAGSESNPDASPSDVREATEDYIAWVLSAEPGAIESYEATVAAHTRGSDAVPPFEPSGYGDPFRPKVPLSQSQDELLRILFHQTGADTLFAQYQGGDGDRALEREVVIGFARAIVLGIDRDPDVRERRWIVQVVQGEEQFFMIVLFTVVMFVVWVQLLFRGWIDPLVDDDLERRLLVLHRERWFIRWMIGAVPSLGFIGTVRGLGAALGKADLIVTVSSRAEQATAIGDVATTLALAFTTTLVALVLALIAGFFDSMTESIEQSVVLRGSAPAKAPQAPKTRDDDGETSPPEADASADAA